MMDGGEEKQVILQEGTMALIPWLSQRVYFQELENSAEINHNKSQGQANEIHHPELSLWHHVQIKDPLTL